MKRVTAQRYARAADAETAMTGYEGRAPGRRWRRPRPWRYHTLRYRVEACSQRQKRRQRGHPAQAEQPQWEQRYGVVVEVDALEREPGEEGWTALTTTVGWASYHELSRPSASHTKR